VFYEQIFFVITSLYQFVKLCFTCENTIELHLDGRMLLALAK